MKNRALILVALFVFGIAFQQCKKDEELEKSVPPALPPESSMVTDFSGFTAHKKDIDTAATQVNWGHSAFNVGVWNVILYVNLAVPVASFQEAFNHTPIQQNDGSWTWSYDYVYFGGTYTANLNGNPVSNGVEWAMTISLAGSYTDFLWYEGFSNYTNTGGSWTLNRSPLNPEPYIGIVWSRDLNAGTAEIKYENIIPNSTENGGYIKYGLTADFYNAFYHIYNKGLENLTEIEWNINSREGHVKDENRFDDIVWHCWDTNLYDIECQ